MLDDPFFLVSPCGTLSGAKKSPCLRKGSPVFDKM